MFDMPFSPRVDARPPQEIHRGWTVEHEITGTWFHYYLFASENREDNLVLLVYWTLQIVKCTVWNSPITFSCKHCNSSMRVCLCAHGLCIHWVAMTTVVQRVQWILNVITCETESIASFLTLGALWRSDRRHNMLSRLLAFDGSLDPVCNWQWTLWYFQKQRSSWKGLTYCHAVNGILMSRPTSYFSTRRWWHWHDVWRRCSLHHIFCSARSSAKCPLQCYTDGSSHRHLQYADHELRLVFVFQDFNSSFRLKTPSAWWKSVTLCAPFQRDERYISC